MIGTVVGWLAAEGKDPAMWHIRHSDGDEAELDEALISDDASSSAADSKAIARIAATAGAASVAASATASAGKSSKKKPINAG